MKQITTNGKDWLFVEIPEGTTIEVSTDGKVLAYQIIPMTAFNDPIWHIDLPNGIWQLHATTDNITEEQAAVIVECENGQFLDYLLFRGHLQNYVDTALQSYATFLTHHNLTGRYAILSKL